MTSFYVKKPHFVGFDTNGLHYVDVLTYTTIRSFNNKSWYPSYEAIAERMGASRSLVSKSVKRLAQASIIKKQRRFDKSNLYFFPDADIVDKIPVEVFTLDLSIYEKAMLLLLRQCCMGTRVNIEGSISQIAGKLGLSYKTVYTQIKSLIDKGFVEEYSWIGSDIKRYRLTCLIDWSYDTDAVNTLTKYGPDDKNIVLFQL